MQRRADRCRDAAAGIHRGVARAPQPRHAAPAGSRHGSRDSPRVSRRSGPLRSLRTARLGPEKDARNLKRCWADGSRASLAPEPDGRVRRSAEWRGVCVGESRRRRVECVSRDKRKDTSHNGCGFFCGTLISVPPRYEVGLGLCRTKETQWLSGFAAVRRGPECLAVGRSGAGSLGGEFDAT